MQYATYLTNALTCATLADIDNAARSNWAAAVQKRLIEALGLIDA